MTYQRLLMRLCSLPMLHGRGSEFLRSRVWEVEEGAGTRLKLKFPQNREFITGESELPVQKEIVRWLRPGDVFYDVGANIGFFSMIAGRLVGPQGAVCAFEPHPQNAAAVRENAKLNGLGNIRLFEVAVGRDSRMDELLMTGWDGGAALSSSVTRPAGPVKPTPVRVVPLDDFIGTEHLPPPSFIKIDVEGAELEVLQGLMKTITHEKPILLCEIDDKDLDSFRQRWAELDACLSMQGYDVTHLDNSYPGMNWNVGHSLAVPSGKNCAR